MIPWLLCGLGLLILLLAGDALVRGAVNLSLRVGIPALIVSLTIVAFGTSAPELIISLSALHEGKPDLALGNVVGSNIFNILFVGGITGMILPFTVPFEMFEIEFPAMLLITAILWMILASGNKLGKIHGIFLLAIYCIAIICSTLMHS